MADILRGADVVSALGENMKKDARLLSSKGVTPLLAILRIGERPDDISYENNAVKRGKSVGVMTRSVTLPPGVSGDELISAIRSLNGDPAVHGVLILRPLPKHIDERAACEALDPGKDVDGITSSSLAGVFTGSGAGFPPCTAQAVIEVLDYYGIDCAGKKAVIIGRSLVVGKPVAMMLLSRNATVTVCHTRTADIPSITRSSDIIIAASGQAEGLTEEYFAPGQVVIDVGINWNEEKGKLCGDVKFDDAQPIAAAITPVPGGIGTVTTSVLISNVIKAAYLTSY